MKAALRLGDTVRYKLIDGSLSDYTGEMTKVGFANGIVNWDFRKTHPLLDTFYETGESLDNLEKEVEMKSKVKPKKNRFKVGDSIRWKHHSKWTGKIVARVNRLQKLSNYKVKWIKMANNKTYSDSWMRVSELEKIPFWKIKHPKKKTLKNKFAVGDRVTTSPNGVTKTWTGTVTSRVNKATKKQNYRVTWDSNCTGNTDILGGKKTVNTWHSHGHIYKLKNTSAAVAVSSERKKEVSSERKKEKMTKRKIPSTTKYNRNKFAKKTSKKTSNKTKSVDGYTVRALIKNGAAAKAGISVGDVITHVDGRPIKARGALGNVLRSFTKRMKKVNVSVLRPDGRKSFIRGLELGRNKAGRATLGVISGKRKASAYNVKVENRAKKNANSALAVVTKAVSDVPENEFEARARIEMEGCAALMADMKGRDALLKANNLKRELKSELRKGMSKNTALVNDYLNAMRNEGKEVEADAKATLSTKGKIVFGLLGLSGVAAVAAGVAHFALGLI